MLSTNSPSTIQRRRLQHRRQNSTPAAFEAPTVRPLPANIRPQRHNRSGMSLDLRGLNLEKVESFQPEDSTVSNTNIGQPQQQFMQVAQPHSQPQPGPHESFMPPSVHRTQSLPSPRTPQQTARGPSSPQALSSPIKPPSEEQVQELHKHIQSVYGSFGQVFINILPTPTATPQKSSQLASHAPVDPALMPTSFADLGNINLEATASAMTFDFDNPEVDLGYESSSYYTSDALSPSPTLSPRQKTIQSFLENIEEDSTQGMSFGQTPSLLPSAMESGVSNPVPFAPANLPQASLPADLDIDATIEYTGISAEEVQRYISEQDPQTNKWTCLYPECGKIFGRRENIRSHVQTHLGDRQYRCNGCGKCFVRQHDLKRHSKIHTGNKPYKCPCGAGFARQDALTRHRQRGMCVGGFPDAVRRPAKRGRPKKNRPDMEDRVAKANRTRRALVSANSSVSAGSPLSDSSSVANSPQPLEDYKPADLQRLLPEMGSFNDPINLAVEPFAYVEPTPAIMPTRANPNCSFDSASSSFNSETKTKDESFTSSFPNDVTSFNILQELSQTNHTPPMSPADASQQSGASMEEAKTQWPASLPKGSSTPSQASTQSNPFSTPPTSPAEPKNDLDDLFNSMSENSCSQFDLEMKAIGDFASLDNTGCEFLDFNM